MLPEYLKGARGAKSAAPADKDGKAKNAPKDAKKKLPAVPAPPEDAKVNWTLIRSH